MIWAIAATGCQPAILVDVIFVNIWEEINEMVSQVWLSAYECIHFYAPAEMKLKRKQPP